MNAEREWLRRNFDEVKPRDFYRSIFPEGELDQKGKKTKGKYIGIIIEVTAERKSDGKPKVNHYTISDELGAIDEVCQSDNFCLCSPISYAGRKRTAEAARFLYAIAVDLDRLRRVGDRPQGLMNLWEGHVLKAKRLPMPTYIVSSGTGVHLYYVFERPVPMFANIAKQLQNLKRELTKKIWNESIVDINDDRDIQQEGIYQGFRMPGTVTKNGERVVAFETGDKVTVEYLNGFVSASNRVTEFRYKSDLTLRDAKEKYPEWYERRIEKKEPRGTIAFSRAVYDNWKRRIIEEAKVGHRYYCLMTLAIYAKKCSFYGPRNPNPVTKKELEDDCWEIMDYFEALTVSDDNHFTAEDVQDAMEAFEDPWITYPRASIEYRTQIPIPPQRRIGFDQATHLSLARGRKAVMKKRGILINEGRPSKRDIVKAWRQGHPDGTIAECVRETGAGRSTVYRWWDD